MGKEELERLIEAELKNTEHAVVEKEGNAYVVLTDYKKTAKRLASIITDLERGD